MPGGHNRVELFPCPHGHVNLRGKQCGNVIQCAHVPRKNFPHGKRRRPRCAERVPHIIIDKVNLIHTACLVVRKIIISLTSATQRRENNAVPLHIRQCRVHAILHISLTAMVWMYGNIPDAPAGQPASANHNLMIICAHRGAEIAIFGHNIILHLRLQFPPIQLWQQLFEVLLISVKTKHIVDKIHKRIILLCVPFSTIDTHFSKIPFLSANPPT